MRAPLAPLLLVLPVLAAGALSAQPAPAAEASAPSAPPARAISAETAAKLAAVAPKYAPPPAAGGATPPPEPDRPRNTIIRLPSYIVTEPKVREFKERELLTPKGRLDLALKRYPGLRFNPLFFLGSNNGVALFMLQEQERLDRLAEMQDLLSLYRYSDTPVPDDVKRKAQQTFIRSNEWIDAGGPHH